MALALKKSLVTLILVLLSTWLISSSRQRLSVHRAHFSYTAEEGRQLRNYAAAQYAFGYHFWFYNQFQPAEKYFRRAVVADMLYVDAWIKLGQIGASGGDPQKARQILAYTDRLTRRVFRWKWPQTLLALKLGLHDLFLRNINALVPFPAMRQNALFVLDQHDNGNALAAALSLIPANRPFYLDWLMRARRVKDAIAVWPQLDPETTGNDALQIRYVNFLLANKYVAEAKNVWLRAGHTGITNPGFERPILRRAFGWHIMGPRKKSWSVRRMFISGQKTGRVLQIAFNGTENVNFYHVYQIVPVDPGKKYELTYEWQSDEISTDRGPFVEIYGYGCKGLYAHGPMMTGTHGWHPEQVAFTVPESCEAMVIRIRRRPSYRFDSKISGRLFIDDFRLSPAVENSMPYGRRNAK